MTRVTVMGGDGIGPEVVDATMTILERMDLGLEFVPADMGLASFQRTGHYLPPETLRTLEGSKAVLFGAITSPVTPDPCYSSPLLQLRKHFDLYANIRPCFPILPEFKLVDLNVVIVRENTEGMYTGREREEGDSVILERVVSVKGCRRIVEKAIKVSRVMGLDRITCVHKANVLRKSDGLFRRIFYEVMEGSGLQADDMIVDAAAAALISKPKSFQCIVTLNLYGDILSDEAAALTGGLGMAPSANIGDHFGLFEPVHGSAPDIAGKGIANPSATILSACLML
jgi:isocitrate/isopropylmalate dehydrogenase